MIAKTLSSLMVWGLVNVVLASNCWQATSWRRVHLAVAGIQQYIVQILNE